MHIFGSLLLAAVLAAQPGPTAPSAGDTALHDGAFASAAASYEAALKADPHDSDANLGLGRLALFDNRLEDAARYLDAAHTTSPDDRRVAMDQQILADRRDSSIYRIAPHSGPVIVPFTSTDPLPTVKVRVNGHEGHFVIDTGAPDIVLDADFAKALHIASQSAGQGLFAGGRRAAATRTHVEHLQVGGLAIDNVPATVLPVNGLGSAHIDGILGTGFFYRFLTTLDYGHARLILEPKRESAAFEQGALARGDALVPMWLVGDHFIFAQAHVNDGPIGLFNIDTGGTFGVQLTKAALDASHITLDEAHKQTGMGGGGPVTFIPFSANVSLGSITRDGISGTYTPEGDPYGIFPFTVSGSISQNFFAHSAVTFDFEAMKVVVRAD